MSHENRKANSQSSRAQASVTSLICHSEDADNKLEGEEDLNGGGHAQADARLQLGQKIKNNSSKDVSLGRN